MNILQGVIGTGLFVGTATALREGGPVGMLLAYIVVGSLCYTVMVRRTVFPAVRFTEGDGIFRYRLGKWLHSSLFQEVILLLRNAL